MAFLCPVRMRRDKKKATNANIERDFGREVMIGRITGSSSIETLVRVGIEKEHGLSPDSKMIILHDFTPCVDDELEVKRGQLVNLLYRENDWAYVITHDSRQEGFIPYSYCVPFSAQMPDLSVKKKLPREQLPDQSEIAPLLVAAVENVDDLQNNNNNGIISQTNGVTSTTSTALKTIQQQQQAANNNLILQPECQPFHKSDSGRFIVLYTFIARDENDISVERGEFVTVLNREDPEWFWIVRSDGQEGFIPATFVYLADTVLQTHQKMLSGAYLQPDSSSSSNVNNLLANTQASNKNTHHHHHQQQQQQQQQNNSAHTNEQISRNVVRNLNRLSQHMPSSSSQEIIPPVCLPTTTTSSSSTTAAAAAASDHQIHQNQEDLRFHGTELVMLYDYKAQAPDDLSVRRGEWIYADLNNQTIEGWLWAYAPKTRKYGFIPKAYARQQPQTQL